MNRLAILLACTGVALAQQQITIDAPKADVARLPRTANRYTDYNAALINAVLYAWDTDREHTTVPTWMETSRFDIVADTGNADPRPALRAVLEQKFAFVAEWQSRPTELWVLRKATDDPQPKAVDANTRGFAGGAILTPGVIDGTYNMEFLGRLLQFNLHGLVVDETKAGDARYQITARWTPQDESGMIFALRQNGFELKRETRDVKYLVISGGQPPETAVAAAPRFTCAVPAAEAAAIAALPDAADLSRSWEGRMGPRRKLAESYPDAAAGIAVQDAIRDKPYLAADWDWALNLYRQMSDSLTGGFLEARLVAALQPSKARRLLEGVAKQAPDFPWAHLGLAELASTAREAEPELRQFLRLCPNSLAASALYGKAEDRQLLHEEIAALENAIGGRQDDVALEAASQIWRMRRKLGEGSPTQHQLETIRAMDRGADSAWYRVLATGYRLLNDEKGAAEFTESILTRYPGTQLAFEIERARWAAQHPTTSPAYAADLGKAVDEWSFRWPQLPQLVFERWAAVSAMPNATDDQLEGAAMPLLQVAKLFPDIYMSVPAPLAVALAMRPRKLHPDDLKAWTDEGMLQARRQEKNWLESEDMPTRKAAEQRLAALAKK